DEHLGGGAPTPSFRAGWTITPTLGFGATYDDNISLFGVNTAEGQNNDVIAAYFPELDVHFSGKHTHFDSNYSGSFLDYRTYSGGCIDSAPYSGVDGWDKRGRIEFRREESAKLKWNAIASVARLPSTDLVDFGGIPYRRSGAETADGRAGFDYVLSNRDALS